MNNQQLVAQSIADFEEYGDRVPVSLSNEIVHLLSDQLYQSPVKAIEELVVNSYDADATVCRIYVPTPDNLEADFIVVFDDGIGMDHEGLVNLWQVGRSNKRTDEVRRRSKRKQIGKFGIGKLATSTIATRLTYITRTDDKVLSVTIDFDDFEDSPTGSGKKITIPVRYIDDWKSLLQKPYIKDVLDAAGIDFTTLVSKKSWTLAVLEELKPKARKIKMGTLHWVLSTAMPLQADFDLFLNRTQITSSKESHDKIVTFELGELPEDRIDALKKTTGENWTRQRGKIFSDSFPSGISGNVLITEQTLLGKSDDIRRSHGFFVRVRGRLINESDPLFGLRALMHGTFNRFRADIDVDDLDEALKASREAIEESKVKTTFRLLLKEVFNEANARYSKHKSEVDQGVAKIEGERTIVSPRLVEHPVADAIVSQMSDVKGAEADESWFYLSLDSNSDVKALVQQLYTDPRSKYTYRYTNVGATSRLVTFHPATATFYINEDHELTQEYGQEGIARILLEDLVTAEALLEVYLREAQVSPHLIGEILERRDKLLRSLARDHSYSPMSIGRAVRDAASDQYELEITLVVAARALGFVATQISGSGEPDGLARFLDYPDGEKKITLEAKSSGSVPSLSAIDFAGLKEHVQRHNADGCLLVAPSYPGQTREDNAAANRAKEQKISCWTVNQLATFIEVAEVRGLTARDVLKIVLNHFSPDDVTQAVEELLAAATWTSRDLYLAILHALKELEERLPRARRNLSMVAATVSANPEFRGIDIEVVEKALKEVASASHGGLTYRDDGTLLIHVALDELARRISGITKATGEPRRLSSFRDICEN